MSSTEDIEAPRADHHRRLKPHGPHVKMAWDPKGARHDYRDPVDATLDASFPASDPPAWPGS
jgi:hypothetical protein